MQKIINGIALFSGLVSLSVVVGGTWVYLEKDNIVNNAKTQLVNGVTAAVSEALPGMLDAAMPELPGVTGGAVPGGGSASPSLPF
tara:strand:- start:136 stop:390 length:255 start_codon:yes stop_codon:yes gene_type:complete